MKYNQKTTEDTEYTEKLSVHSVSSVIQSPTSSPSAALVRSGRRRW